MSEKPPKRSNVKLIVAEDVRGELGGKFSALGVFPGERFAVGGSPPVLPPGSPPVAFFLSSLAFLFVVSGAEGKYAGRVRVIAPDGKTVISDSPIEQTQFSVDRPTVIAGGSKPFVGPAFGTYKISLELGGSKMTFPLLIEAGPSAHNLAMPTSEIAKTSEPSSRPKAAIKTSKKRKGSARRVEG